MGFVDAVKTCLIKKPLTMQGRAPRSEYWWYFLFQMILVALMGVYGYLNGLQDPEALGVMPNDPVSILLAVLGLALLMPAWSVAVRRMHDRGRTGLWVAPLFGWNLISSALQLYAQLTGDLAVFVEGAMVIGALGVALGLGSIIMLIYFCFRGTEGPNAYGPDPLGGQADADIFA